MFEDYNFGKDVVEKYIDFHIKESESMLKQTFSLKEDMLQVIYSNGDIIDVGWYPEFDINGSFKVMLVRNGDWDRPLFEKECDSIEYLKTVLNSCIALRMEA